MVEWLIKFVDCVTAFLLKPNIKAEKGTQIEARKLNQLNQHNQLIN